MGFVPVTMLFFSPEAKNGLWKCLPLRVLMIKSCPFKIFTSFLHRAGVATLASPSRSSPCRSASLKDSKRPMTSYKRRMLRCQFVGWHQKKPCLVRWIGKRKHPLNPEINSKKTSWKTDPSLLYLLGQKAQALQLTLGRWLVRRDPEGGSSRRTAW